MRIQDVKILCLNLPRRVERKEHAKKQFHNAGILDVEFIPAIDGKAYKLSTAVTSPFSKSEQNPNGYIQHGWIANHISYQQIFFWAQIAFPGKDILVFEDDVVLCDNFITKYNKALQNLPEDWDLLYCGVWDWKSDQSIEINPLIKKPKFPVLAHCVLYRSMALPILHKELEQLKITYDLQVAEQLIETGKLNAYATSESLASPSNAFASDGSPYQI